jgi:hypothetical protein
LDTRLGGPQSRSGHRGEEKNSQPLSGLKPPIRPNDIQLRLHVPNYKLKSVRYVGLKEVKGSEIMKIIVNRKSEDEMNSKEEQMIKEI